MPYKFLGRLLKVSCISVAMLSATAQAANILIINGTSTTSEAGTTAEITSTLDTLLQSQGNTTTISDPVPADISGYDQVWDIRFNPAFTAAEQTRYVSFLAAGGNMFVMGENSGFNTRNTSVLALIAAAGGGSLSFVTPNSTQNVNEQFRTPNDIATISYCAPGGATAGGVTAGNGVFLSDDGVTGGSAIGFPSGSLTSAPAGSLAVVFDVNFMQPCGTNAIEFLENLTLFVLEGGGGTPTVRSFAPVPTLSAWGILAMILLISLIAIGRVRF